MNVSRGQDFCGFNYGIFWKNRLHGCNPGCTQTMANKLYLFVPGSSAYKSPKETPGRVIHFVLSTVWMGDYSKTQYQQIYVTH